MALLRVNFARSWPKDLLSLLTLRSLTKCIDHPVFDTDGRRRGAMWGDVFHGAVMADLDSALGPLLFPHDKPHQAISIARYKLVSCLCWFPKIDYAKGKERVENRRVEIVIQIPLTRAQRSADTGKLIAEVAHQGAVAEGGEVGDALVRFIQLKRAIDVHVRDCCSAARLRQGEVGVGIFLEEVAQRHHADEGEAYRPGTISVPRNDEREIAKGQGRGAALTEGTDQIQLGELVALLEAEDCIRELGWL